MIEWSIIRCIGPVLTVPPHHKQRSVRPNYLTWRHDWLVAYICMCRCRSFLHSFTLMSVIQMLPCTNDWTRERGVMTDDHDTWISQDTTAGHNRNNLFGTASYMWPYYRRVRPSVSTRKNETYIGKDGWIVRSFVGSLVSWLVSWIDCHCRWLVDWSNRTTSALEDRSRMVLTSNDNLRIRLV
jgi:hypothetical protein